MCTDNMQEHLRPVTRTRTNGPMDQWTKWTRTRTNGQWTGGPSGLEFFPNVKVIL